MEYEDTNVLNRQLECNICKEPFTDPVCLPCHETYCRRCVTNWITRSSSSCPHCRQPISTKDFRAVPHQLQNMLDRLLVRCLACGERNIRRGNFDRHIQEVCPQTVISCPADSTRCSWRGKREQVVKHLRNCEFLPMRSIIIQLLDQNQCLENSVNTLNDQVSEARTQNQTQQNNFSRQRKLLDGQLEQQQNEINQQETNLNEQIQENQQLRAENERLRAKRKPLLRKLLSCISHND